MQNIFDEIMRQVRKKATEFLEDSYGKCSEFDIQYFMSLTVNDIEEIINKIMIEYNNGWILVEEQLPEEPEENWKDMEDLQRYLVMFESGHTPVMLFYAGNGNWHDGDNYFKKDGFMKVIAWQPAPVWNEDIEKHKRNNGEVLHGIISGMLAKSAHNKDGENETVL